MKRLTDLLLLMLALGGSGPSLAAASSSPSVDSLVASAEQKSSNGDERGAIADYSQAITLQPNDPELLAKRGLSEESLGDADSALTDYDAAIRLKPGDADYYAYRGSAKLAKGDTDGCYKDCLKAVQIDPKNPMAFLNMGFQSLILQKFASAASNFSKFVDAVPRSDYAHFMLWVARARNGEAATATKDLQEFLDHRTRGTPDDWPSSIGRFLTGKLDEAGFLKIANETPPPHAGENQCEAYFYAGSKRLVSGDKKTALVYFQKSVATGEKGQTEYTCAQAEVKILQSEKSTPAP